MGNKKISLVELAKQLENVSKACKVKGYSRDTFNWFRELYENGEEEVLHEIGKKRLPFTNKVPEHIEKAVIEIAIELPACGQKSATNKLKERGISISSGGIRSVWKRHNLETFEKRLKALEAKIAQGGIILTEGQRIALEKAKEQKDAQNEIETQYSGYLGGQDTYYLGYIEGIGKIYQQTFVDAYSRVAFVKLYVEKTAITAAGFLNDIVIPFFEEHKIPLLRILTDRGMEYCGKPETHAYQLYLGIENIDHSSTKTSSPRTNGICEGFHKIMQDECYRILFRKKTYNSLEDLQVDVDQWLRSYNERRPYSGKYCYGRTPMQTFLDTRDVALKKNMHLFCIG